MHTPAIRKRSWFHTLIQRLGASRVGATIFARLLHHLDRPILRLSHGRRSYSGPLSGAPIVMLTTVGARSGRPRSVPLTGIPHGEDVILIASNWGQAAHPGWYINLRAHPRALLLRDGQTGVYAAREAVGAERNELWRRALEVYPGYAAYKERTQGRTIPVLVLTPVLT